jgi:hypothetical protein
VAAPLRGLSNKFTVQTNAVLRHGELNTRRRRNNMKLIKWSGLTLASSAIILGIACSTATTPTKLPTNPSSTITAATSSPAATPTILPTQSNTLKLIKEWHGTGTKKTEPFSISKTPWVIEWKLEKGEYAQFLGVTLYDTAGKYVDLVANSTTPGSESSFIYQKGDFYLDIISTGEWNIKITGE